MHFLGSKYHKHSFAAAAMPWIPLGGLQHSPAPLAGRGRKKRVTEGKGKERGNRSFFFLTWSAGLNRSKLKRHNMTDSFSTPENEREKSGWMECTYNNTTTGITSRGATQQLEWLSSWSDSAAGVVQPCLTAAFRSAKYSCCIASSAPILRCGLHTSRLCTTNTCTAQLQFTSLSICLPIPLLSCHTHLSLPLSLSLEWRLTRLQGSGVAESILLLLLVCVSWTITGQPRNSIFICRV